MSEWHSSEWVPPKPRRSIIKPVGRVVALDVESYRFVRGGDA